MKRFTTPTHIFELPFDSAGVVKDVRVTYSQNGEEVICKKLIECVLNGNEIIVDLTAEETGRLNPDLIVEIEVKVYTQDGDELISDPPIRRRCHDTACKEILGTEG
jgi:hypothetical protein